MNELTIFDQIGLDPETGQGLTAKQFDSNLKALGQPSAILLRINSPGGDVMQAMAIFSMLKASRATVTARIEGIAASAASLIAMAADRIEISANAFMLIHQPWTVASGSADDLATAAGDLERMSEQYARIYSARSGQSISTVTALMEEDRLMTADEAVSLGYADAIAGDGSAPNMSGLPRRHRATIKAARRETDYGWGRALERLTAQREGRLLPSGGGNKAVGIIARGWEAAIARVRAERGIGTGDNHGWDAAIRKTVGGRR